VSALGRKLWTQKTGIQQAKLPSAEFLENRLRTQVTLVLVVKLKVEVLRAELSNAVTL
jgi:hypothetical protein